MNPRPTEIRIEGLDKAFDGHVVLAGINLEIARGDFIAVVGGSGCGKTVLLHHVLGLLTADAGRLWVADHDRDGAPLVDLAELDADDVNRLHTHWGVVFQRNALFSGSVEDNLGLGLKELRDMTPEAIAPLARRALGAVALPDTAEFFATSVESLSGGMAKRLAVARALMMEPVTLFYDEPTTGLDPTSAAQIQDLIAATHAAPGAGGTARTTLVVTHDKDLLARLEPRVIMLHQGKIAFDGPFADFRASPSPIIRPYFDLMPALHGRASRT